MNVVNNNPNDNPVKTGVLAVSKKERCEVKTNAIQKDDGRPCCWVAKCGKFQ